MLYVLQYPRNKETNSVILKRPCGIPYINGVPFLLSRYAYASYMIKSILESNGGIENIKALMESSGKAGKLNIVYDIGCFYSSHLESRKVCRLFVIFDILLTTFLNYMYTPIRKSPRWFGVTRPRDFLFITTYCGVFNYCCLISWGFGLLFNKVYFNWMLYILALDIKKLYIR